MWFDIGKQTEELRTEGGKFIVPRQAKLCFMFSADKETAEKNWGKLGGPVFYSPDDFRFDGVFLNIRPGYRRIPLKEAVKNQDELLRTTKIDYDLLKKMFDDMEPIPEIQCPEAEAEIRKLAKEQGVEDEEIEKLI